jgi:hypothetical protein
MPANGQTPRRDRFPFVEVNNAQSHPMTADTGVVIEPLCDSWFRRTGQNCSSAKKSSCSIPFPGNAPEVDMAHQRVDRLRMARGR